MTESTNKKTMTELINKSMIKQQNTIIIIDTTKCNSLKVIDAEKVNKGFGCKYIINKM